MSPDAVFHQVQPAGCDPDPEGLCVFSEHRGLGTITANLKRPADTLVVDPTQLTSQRYSRFLVPGARNHVAHDLNQVCCAASSWRVVGTCASFQLGFGGIALGTRWHLR